MIGMMVVATLFSCSDKGSNPSPSNTSQTTDVDDEQTLYDQGHLNNPDCDCYEIMDIIVYGNLPNDKFYVGKNLCNNDRLEVKNPHKIWYWEFENDDISIGSEMCDTH